MMSPVLDLRQAIRTTLLARSELVAALGGPRVYDEVPRGIEPPYIAFGDVQVRDWSTVTDQGCEQFLVLNAWSTQPGTREALAFASQVAAATNGAALTLTDHHLVNLRVVSLETRRENNGRFARASVRLRAVTEPV